MKRYPALLVIKELQIKTTLKFHFASVRMAIVKKIKNNKYWSGCEGKGRPTHYWWERK
jgi:hypothetical protein